MLESTWVILKWRLSISQFRVPRVSRLCGKRNPGEPELPGEFAVGLAALVRPLAIQRCVKPCTA